MRFCIMGVIGFILAFAIALGGPMVAVGMVLLGGLGGGMTYLAEQLQGWLDGRGR